MQKTKNMLPEIIKHTSPLAEPAAFPALMPKQDRPLITIDINTELVLRCIRYLKEAIPAHLLKK